MQSGRFATQRAWGILPPFTEESWTETWYPLSRIGPPVLPTGKSRFPLFQPGQQGRALLGVHVTAAFPSARVRLLRGSVTEWERMVDLSPSEPLVEELALEPGGPEATVLVTESSGRELARLCRRAGPVAEVPVTLPPHVQSKQTAANAEGAMEYRAGPREARGAGPKPAYSTRKPCGWIRPFVPRASLFPSLSFARGFTIRRCSACAGCSNRSPRARSRSGHASILPPGCSPVSASKRRPSSSGPSCEARPFAPVPRTSWEGFSLACGIPPRRWANWRNVRAHIPGTSMRFPCPHAP